MTKYKLRQETKILWQTDFSLVIFYAKGNHYTLLLNFNSDAYTKTRLRYTKANYGLRLRANDQTNNLASSGLLIVSPNMLSNSSISSDGLSSNLLLQ